MTSRTSCPITFLGTEVRLTGLLLPGPSFLPLLKTGVTGVDSSPQAHLPFPKMLPTLSKQPGSHFCQLPQLPRLKLLTAQGFVGNDLWESEAAPYSRQRGGSDACGRSQECRRYRLPARSKTEPSRRLRRLFCRGWHRQGELRGQGTAPCCVRGRLTLNGSLNWALLSGHAQVQPRSPQQRAFERLRLEADWAVVTVPWCTL